uniref:Zinc finger and BTB domain containing 1 n=1 Tax=Petromyzon marinus TaxID=7757 RepID=S4RW85_PETMA
VGEELSLVNDNHLPDLLRELCELREKGSFCDVVVEVQSRRYLAHKAVLSSTCRYFRSLFLDVPCSSMGPFVIDFLTIKLFHQILEFVYKGHIKADKVEIRDLYKAAKDLGLDCLEEICQRTVPLEYLEECSDSESEISQSLSDAGAQMSPSADGCVEDGGAISAEIHNDVDGGGKTNAKHKAENCVTKNKGEKSRQSNDARSSDSVHSQPCNGNKLQKSVKAGKNSEQEFCISNVESMSRRAGERAVAEAPPDKHDSAQRRGDLNYTTVGICEVKMEPLDEEAFILPSRKESCLSHVGLKANDNENEMVQSSDVGAADSFVLCQVCGEFVQEMGLKDHAAVHLDLATMECKVCGVAFGSFGEAVEHVLLHTGITASPCEGCGEVFLSKDSLSLHVRDCGKGEPKDHLDDFQMDESEGLDGGPPERVFCQVCGVSLPRKFLAVRKHAKCHVDSEKRECRVCGRKCNYLSNVIKHTLIHIGVCLFTCDICGKKFLNSIWHLL